MSRPAAPSTCSGFELVSRVLDHPQGGVEALVELAGGGETDWLEFKAAMVGRPEDRKNPKENEADGYWNVAEAVLAMANSRGGVVLLGVDDNANAVGLATGDPRRVLETRGMDAFLRMEVLERIHPANSLCRWNTGLKGIWELEHPWPPDQFVIRQVRFQERPIAALLVKPVPVGNGCLIATQNGDERLPKRVEGNLGRVECLRGRIAIAEYERNRSPHGEDLGSLLARFLKRAEKGGTEDEYLEAAIGAWHSKFRRQSADLNTFTPLDAEERFHVEDCFESLLPKAAFEPQAEEILPDYISEDWMEDDSDDPQEDGDFEETDELESAVDSDTASEHPEPPASPRVARSGGLFELLSEEPRAVLVGEPGGGKTTCLRRWTLESVLQYQPGQTVTLFISLAKWATSGGLSTLLRRTTGLSMGQVERLVLAGRCRMLFDGLNECPDALRVAAINELTALLENYPNLPLVISSRSAESVAPFRLPTFSVQPLSDAQQIQFLKAYLPDPDRASKLFEQIQSQPGAETFASNPLLLRMIVEVARKDGELPRGRALLYRRWIHDWYRREKEKADRAKDPLPWNEKEMFEGLSAIALKARMRGSRIATEEEALHALENLVKNRSDFLQRITQSPLLRKEEGRLQFRHETFQEYLCAEALLLHPDALQNEGPERYGTWGMPLAYAAELSDPLHEALKTAMWRIAPWLAASVAQPNECPPPLPEKLEQGVRWAVEGRAPDDLNDQLTYGLWYQPDAAIKYVVLSSPSRFQRWHAFELSQLRSASYPSQASKIILRSICLSKFWTPESIRKAELPLDLWLSGSSGPAVWNPLINAGLTSNGELLKKASLGTGVHFINAGTAKLEEFCINLRRRWIMEGTPRDVIFAITSHVLSPTDFNTGQRHRLAMASNASEAVGLVNALGLNPEEFSSEQRRHLVKTASANDAGGLIKSRILKPEDFSDAERLRLATTASADGAVRLLNTGIFHPEDFSCEQRQRLAATASAEGVGALRKARLLSPEDFSDEQRQKLASTASAEGVAALLKTKVLRAEDFSEQQRQRLAATASAEGAVKLFNAKVLRLEDFSQEQRERLAATASAEGIRALLKAQILNSGDFSADQRERLAATASAEGIKALLKARILSREDFSDSQSQREVATQSGIRIKDLQKVRDVRENISEADRRCAGMAVSTKNPRSPRSQAFGSEWIAPSPDSLSDFRLRQTISTQLRAMVFEGLVLNSNPHFAFLESQSFTNNVFCSATVWPPETHLEVGQRVRFSVHIKFNVKMGIWSYAARNLNVLSRDES